MSLALVAAPASQALITPPVTVDGPSSSILGFGGVAMAGDGGGGVVYLKAVEGVPHVFASVLSEGKWSPPLRVDADQPYAASQPRIAAGPKGELLVVWVTGVATVHGKLRAGLYSATLGPRSASFGPSQLIDPDVGEGIGVDPSVSATAPGQAIVAYRAITFTFDNSGFTTAVQLRPGDVMADVRVARLKEDRWSRLGAINRNPEASMRPPSPTNGPKVIAGNDGGAAVAWQEPDQTGAARIWVRRVFGTTPGPVLEASPTTWQGSPVTADADAFSLAVSAFAQVRVAFRIAPEPGSALAGRILLNSLQANYSETAGKLTGAQIADGGAGGLGPPFVAANDEGGGEGTMRLGFLSGPQLHLIGVDNSGALEALTVPPGPPAQPGAQVLTTVNPKGGGVAAYVSTDPNGRPAVAIRQEFKTGAAQTGVVSGAQGGPISELAVGPSGGGDGLIAFLQGEPGHLQIVADRVSAPPTSFHAEVPPGWVRPNRAKVHWEEAESAIPPLRYSVLLGGRVVKANLKRRFYRPPAGQLGSGAKTVRVLATDGLGQQVLSKGARLKVDAEPPIVEVKAQPKRGRVSISVSDPDSGIKGKKPPTAKFGDGGPALRLAPSGNGLLIHHRRGKAPSFHISHRYEGGGLYSIVVRARDKVGNKVVRHFEVKVR
ncbi:MAG TPA: hypothetical protein VG816_14905 [Solirubrobacterales bacterium]|nr:hypothetical protein [Solirubrobacterales bacterium]